MILCVYEFFVSNEFDVDFKNVPWVELLENLVEPLVKDSWKGSSGKSSQAQLRSQSERQPDSRRWAHVRYSRRSALRYGGERRHQRSFQGAGSRVKCLFGVQT